VSNIVEMAAGFGQRKVWLAMAHSFDNPEIIPDSQNYEIVGILGTGGLGQGGHTPAGSPAIRK
jgi:hypothetical protein